MRVLMIGTDRAWFGLNYSGDLIERHQAYARQADCFLDIIVFTKKGFKLIEPDERIKVYPTNSLLKLGYIFGALKIAKSICNGNKFNLIVCQDPFLTGLVGWLIKKRFKVPLLIHFHGDFWQNHYWLKQTKRWWHWCWYNRLLLLLSRFLTNKADGIRVVSSGIKEKLLKTGLAEEKIRVIPTPVNLDKFEKHNQEKVSELKFKNKGYKTIINIGLHDPSAKDYPTLFKAISLVNQKYQKLAFWQIGANLNLKKEIKGEGDLILSSVKSLAQQELVDYYYASDIYVSSSSNESLGKVLIEAMACGLPVVATTTTGSKEIIIDGENGFLVPIGDSQALAEKILYLLNNPVKAKEIGQIGKKMVKDKFNQTKTIEEIINYWRDLAKQ